MIDPETSEGSLWEHLSELRRVLISACAIIASAVILGFAHSDFLLSLLSSPLNTHATPHETLREEKLEFKRIVNKTPETQTVRLEEGSAESVHKGLQTSPGTYALEPGGALTYTIPTKQPTLVILGPLEGMLTALKVSFWIGITGSSPLWLWVLMRFLMPGLHQREKRLLFSFLALSAAFITAGCLFAFYVTLPIANDYLMTFNASVGTNLWSLKHYLDYTLFLILANGIAFECCAVGVFAVRLGFVSAEAMAAKRRHAIVGGFVLAALLTPPDVLTQLLLAFPLIGLYEGLILYARLLRRWHALTASEP